MTKIIIFDMDGVLIDSMKYHISSWGKAFKDHNVSITNEELALCEGMSYEQTIELFAKRHNIKFTEAQEHEIYLEKKRLLAKTFKIKMFPHVLRNLKLFKSKGVRMAVVTGANKEFSNTIIKKYFSGLFEVVVSGDDIKNGKPSPEPYLKALKMLKLTKSDVSQKNIIVIENAPLGIESAIRSKLNVLAIETTLGEKYLKGAKKIFKDHKSLFKYINQILYE
jgi:beta-phosphoglucomutase